MKIVTLQEFVDLPEGTLFSFHLDGGACYGLHRKGASLKETDFYFSDLTPFFETDSSVDTCMQFVVDDIEGRWGIHDRNAQFVVYEEDDIDMLYSMLPPREAKCPTG